MENSTLQKQAILEAKKAGKLVKGTRMEGLSSEPQNYIKSECGSISGETKKGGSLELTHHPASHNQGVINSMRDAVSENEGEGNGGKYPMPTSGLHIHGQEREIGRTGGQGE